MDGVFNAAEAFFEHLATVGWRYLGIALLFHVAKMAARARSWRNILAASYPDATVRWRDVFGSYAAGVGVNAVVPARGGDFLKLYLVKHRIDGATYPTLAATLVVETLFDVAVTSVLLVWALQQGVLPGLDVIPRLPEIDWLWLFQHPEVGAVVAAVAVAGAFVLGFWSARRVDALRTRLAQGFAILRTPRRYVRRVVPWQALDWGCRLTTLYFFLLAFGIPADLHNALLVQVTNGLSTILPLTPAGIGTEQALLVYVFSGTASATAVLSFSVGMKLVVIAANVALGFAAIAVMMKTFRWRSAVDDDRVVSAPAPPPRGSHPRP